MRKEQLSVQNDQDVHVHEARLAAPPNDVPRKWMVGQRGEMTSGRGQQFRHERPCRDTRYVTNEVTHFSYYQRIIKIAICEVALEPFDSFRDGNRNN